MRLFFYAQPFDPLARSLYQELVALNGVQQHDFFGSLSGLTRYLRAPLGMSTIGVVWPANPRELSKLCSMRFLLRDIRIILILPDRRPATVSNGHLLRPRFVSYPDGDMADVVAVAAKVIDTHKTPAFQMAT